MLYEEIHSPSELSEHGCTRAQCSVNTVYIDSEIALAASPQGVWGICPLVPSCNHFGLFQMLFFFSWVSTTLHPRASTSQHVHPWPLPWDGYLGRGCGVKVVLQCRSPGWRISCTESCAFPFAATGTSGQLWCCRKPDDLWFILRECQELFNSSVNLCK